MKYYQVDVRHVEDTEEWYNTMESLGFTFEDHWHRENFIDIYCFFFNEDKEYITYFNEEDASWDCDTKEYDYSPDSLEDMQLWFNEQHTCYNETVEFIEFDWHRCDKYALGWS